MTGWTLAYIYDEVTLSELNDLCDDLVQHPPVDDLIAAFLGYEPPSKPSADPMEDFLEALMMSGMGRVEGWGKKGGDLPN